MVWMWEDSEGVRRDLLFASRQALVVSRQAGGVSRQAWGKSRQAGGTIRQACGGSRQAGNTSRRAGNASHQARSAHRQVGCEIRRAGGVSHQAGATSRRVGVIDQSGDRLIIYCGRDLVNSRRLRVVPGFNTSLGQVSCRSADPQLSLSPGNDIGIVSEQGVLDRLL